MQENGQYSQVELFKNAYNQIRNFFFISTLINDIYGILALILVEMIINLNFFDILVQS